MMNHRISESDSLTDDDSFIARLMDGCVVLLMTFNRRWCKLRLGFT